MRHICVAPFIENYKELDSQFVSDWHYIFKNHMFLYGKKAKNHNSLMFRPLEKGLVF